MAWAVGLGDLFWVLLEFGFPRILESGIGFLRWVLVFFNSRDYCGRELDSLSRFPSLPLSMERERGGTGFLFLLFYGALFD